VISLYVRSKVAGCLEPEEISGCVVVAKTHESSKMRGRYEQHLAGLTPVKVSPDGVLVHDPIGRVSTLVQLR
jgi:hypothetical protein